MSNFPTSLDSFTNPGAGDYMDAVGHAAQHSDVNDAVEALEAKLGISASTPTSGKLLRGTGAGSSAWDKDAPTGTIVGTSDSQTLTNKTLTSPTINTAIINNPTLKTDTVAEFTSAAGVTVDGLLIKDSKLATNDSVVTSNITAAAVTAPKINFGGSGSGVWWEEIGRTTLGVAGDTISVTGMGARKYLRIYANIQASTALSVLLRFNNDSAANYALRFATPSGVAGSSVSQTSINNFSNATSTSTPLLLAGDILNFATSPKFGTFFTTGGSNAAGTAPDWLEIFGKWVNTTDQITRIDILNTGAGDFAIGSELVVLGHN